MASGSITALSATFDVLLILVFLGVLTLTPLELGTNFAATPSFVRGSLLDAFCRTSGTHFREGSEGTLPPWAHSDSPAASQ